mmetsp:Transcript_23282/g.76495  ORF Transcript_23282/g.76495 Transcript_23282/m.76495 type:complete len:238 (-) Transcript_23282:31-744(-)
MDRQERWQEARARLQERQGLDGRVGQGRVLRRMQHVRRGRRPVEVRGRQELASEQREVARGQSEAQGLQVHQEAPQEVQEAHGEEMQKAHGEGVLARRRRRPRGLRRVPAHLRHLRRGGRALRTGRSPVRVVRGKHEQEVVQKGPARLQVEARRVQAQGRQRRGLARGRRRVGRQAPLQEEERKALQGEGQGQEGQKVISRAQGATSSHKARRSTPPPARSADPSPPTCMQYDSRTK